MHPISSNTLKKAHLNTNWMHIKINKLCCSIITVWRKCYFLMKLIQRKFSSKGLKTQSHSIWLNDFIQFFTKPISISLKIHIRSGAVAGGDRVWLKQLWCAACGIVSGIIERRCQNILYAGIEITSINFGEINTNILTCNM